jgi:hypothetical protein
MKKRRTIPTIPVECLSEGTEKAKYQKILYNSILEGVEHSLSSNKNKFILARVNNGTDLQDIEILKESFQTNLETILDYYEQQEEYELCSKVLKLINQVK